MTSFTPEQRELALGMDERAARAAWAQIAEPADKDVHLWCVTHGGYAEGIVGILTAGDNGMVSGVVEKWLPRLGGALTHRLESENARYSIRIVIPSDDEWPEKLDRLGDTLRPYCLFVRGDAGLLADEKKIALVGARASTGYGEHVTMEFAAGLADRHITVVSGGAYGVDGMAHRTVLASGGRTIAVLAGGVDRFYPSGNEALLQRVVETGAVISECPPGSPPTKWRFLQRNRIVAAMSDAVVVVEAGWRSGSLNTAGHAHALGIPLGAVPGPITSAASAGCHRLIRDFGAACLTGVEDIIQLAEYESKGETDDISR